MRTEKDIRHVVSFFLFFFFFFFLYSGLTQLWLRYLVYKHEKERNAPILMHISVYSKESCVHGCNG